MEANEFLVRVKDHKTVIFPKEMLKKQATMTWAGDVGKMIARLVLNEKAYGETYTAATAEHHTWGEILKTYRRILGMRTKLVSLDTYRSVVGRVWQIKYDRMLDRVIDNTKVLRAAGMQQSELMPLSEGLRIELYKFMKNPKFKTVDKDMQARFDRVTGDARKVKRLRRKLSDALRKVRAYRKNGLLKSAVRQKLQHAGSLKNALRGVKRLLKGK